MILHEIPWHPSVLNRITVILGKFGLLTSFKTEKSETKLFKFTSELSPLTWLINRRVFVN